ncbi:class II aldolase/adducin family protein [Streptomyces sp. NPDC051014]|uniref:class II aldolase/adducin family protein n=1 Tax=Streptomyces sp. NPDC051014 TaxID=3155751 RepID=UPI0033C9436A
MRYEEERLQLVDIVGELFSWKILNGAGGNVSMRLPDGNILMSDTRLAFGGWKVTPLDFIVMAPDGAIVEQTSELGAAGTPMHLDLYQLLPDAGAVVHAHSPYVLAFASLGLPVPSVINRSDLFGEIPCLHADDLTVKADFQKNPVPLDLPEGMVQRPEVAAVHMLEYRRQLDELIAPRAGELKDHGLAFTMYRHGTVVVGRRPSEMTDYMLRLEESARTALFQAQLNGGVVYPNRLYRPERLTDIGATTTPSPAAPVTSPTGA